MRLSRNVNQVERMFFENVVRQRKTFHYSKLEEQLNSFISGIVTAGYQLKGPFFYSLNNTPIDEIVDIEFFIPIRDTVFHIDGYKYSSYFGLQDLLQTTITGDFSITTELEYEQLLLNLKENHLEMLTPFYHILFKDELKTVMLLTGYKHQ